MTSQRNCRWVCTALLGCLLLGLVSSAEGRPSRKDRKKKAEERFEKAPPQLGAPLPHVSVYDPQGREFETSQLRGHYTVLTFGCLT